MILIYVDAGSVSNDVLHYLGIMVKKYTIPKTNAEGYALVLAFYEGNKTAMAEALGVTRQLLYYWERKGIPPERIRSIADATGYPPAHIKPQPY